jgi:hypothetical protein
MRASVVLLSAAGVLSVAGAAAWWLTSGEVIRVRATEAVPLFDPQTLAGQIGSEPKQIGQLAAGEELPVVACIDRKSDINVHASYQGREVAVGEWKAKVQLFRRHAYPWQAGATTSCQGFFESISTHA